MTRSLRIAIVLNPLGIKRKGGEHAPQLARELLGRGHDVRTFGDVVGGVPQSGGRPERENGAAPLEGSGVAGFEPDAILAYDALSPAAMFGARQATRLGVPLVLVDEGFPDHGRTFERMLRWFGKRLWGRLVRRAARRVVALDPVAEEQALARGFRREQVVVRMAGVDLTRFRPELASALPARHGVRGRFLLHVGRLEDARGLETLLAAFANTVGRRDDWSLLFAGAGSAAPRIRAEANRLGVGAHVHFVGVPRAEELPGLFGSATALVVPVLDDDVTSAKLRRAMACGLPVIASSVPRLAAYVEHDRTGLLVPAGDRVAWTEALSTLAGDPMRRLRWGGEARATAEERFAWPNVAAAFEELLLELVETDAQAETAETASTEDGDADGARDEGRLPA